MNKLKNIFSIIRNKNFLFVMLSVLSLSIMLQPSTSWAYRLGGGCGGQNRIAETKGLTEEEKAKINEIYAAQNKLCETQEKIARKIGKDYDFGVTSGTFFGKKLTEEEKKALNAADVLQNKDQHDRLAGLVNEYGSIKDKEAMEALRYLQEKYPEDYKTLMNDLNESAKYKLEDPQLYQKAKDVSTDAVRDAGIPLLNEMATHSNPVASMGNEAAETAAKKMRDNTYRSVVNNMRKDGASDEAIKQYEENVVAAEGIIAGHQTFGLTNEQARETIHNKQDETQRVLNDGKCLIADMQEKYQSKCYACVIVKTLLETFLVACSQVYDLTSEAGSKILVMGGFIWLAFFALKNVSSFANVEPGAMVNTLFVFLFKVMVAYIVINSGLTTIIHYTINPLVTAGADYGLGLMSTMQDTSGVADHYKDYNKALYDAVVPTIKSADGAASADIISAEVINKIMLFTFNLDKTVSTNLVIGHALTCHAMNAGAWNLGLFYMVNIWIWLCGAAIWFCGFMLTLGICYYLLDISFKLGFAIIALPVVIGLWPFNITKNKLPQTVSIILSSAATFAFLALTTTYALVLISASLRDKNVLLKAIEDEKTDWISDTFDISGPYFIIIMFAYLYAIKLIGSTISDYVDKFFSDGIFGGQSPMHHKLTQATDFVKQKATGAASAAGGAIAGQVGKGAEKVLGKAVGFVKNKFKPKDKDKAKDKDKNKGSSPVSSAGKTTKNAGKTLEQGGKATEQAGKVAEKGGKGLSKGGDGMMKAGKALSGTGLGAIIGVPMIIAGGAVKGAGAVTQYAGKATKKAGQAMKKSGKTMKKIGERMEKAGDKMEKTGNTLKYGKDSADNNPPSDDK